MMKEVS